MQLYMVVYIGRSVRIEVFPERDGNNKFPLAAESDRVSVRIEVFPERDGNLQSADNLRSFSQLVRIEVFPERDGNSSKTFLHFLKVARSPNRGLP